MHTALRLRVLSWEIPGPLRSRAVEEPLSECPLVVNAHMQTEIAAAGCHGRSEDLLPCYCYATKANIVEQFAREFRNLPLQSKKRME